MFLVAYELLFGKILIVVVSQYLV